MFTIRQKTFYEGWQTIHNVSWETLKDVPPVFLDFIDTMEKHSLNYLAFDKGQNEYVIERVR